MARQPSPSGDVLLLAGVAAGAIFVAVTVVEIASRPGFDIRRHAISVLSLGERGWVMVATFVAAGVLTMLCAIGMRLVLVDRRGGAWGPILVGAYGLGLVMAGIFPAPAGMGFPPGTPDDQMPVMDAPAILHSLAFVLAFGSLIAACLVFARAFARAGSAGAAAFSAGAGAAMPALIVLGMANIVPTGIAFYLAALIGWGWLAAVAVWSRGKCGLTRATVRVAL